MRTVVESRCMCTYFTTSLDSYWDFVQKIVCPFSTNASSLLKFSSFSQFQTFLFAADNFLFCAPMLMTARRRDYNEILISFTAITKYCFNVIMQQSNFNDRFVHQHFTCFPLCLRLNWKERVKPEEISLSLIVIRIIFEISANLLKSCTGKLKTQFSCQYVQVSYLLI